MEVELENDSGLGVVAAERVETDGGVWYRYSFACDRREECEVSVVYVLAICTGFNT